MTRQEDSVLLPAVNLCNLVPRHELDSDETAARTATLRSRRQAYDQDIDNLAMLETSPHNADGSLLSDGECGMQRRELLQKEPLF